MTFSQEIYIQQCASSGLMYCNEFPLEYITIHYWGHTECQSVVSGCLKEVVSLTITFETVSATVADKVERLKTSHHPLQIKYRIMQIVHGGKVSRLHDLVVIRGKTFVIV